MDDLIRRQDAIDALERIFDRCEEIEAHLPEGDPDRTGYKMYPDYMTVWKYLHQLPSAQQWIPCSERLPEKEGQYLVTLDFAWGKEIEMGDWFIFEDGHGEWVNSNSHVTVAWMELPKPWKESEE